MLGHEGQRRHGAVRSLDGRGRHRRRRDLREGLPRRHDLVPVVDGNHKNRRQHEEKRRRGCMELEAPSTTSSLPSIQSLARVAADPTRRRTRLSPSPALTAGLTGVPSSRHSSSCPGVMTSSVVLAAPLSLPPRLNFLSTSAPNSIMFFAVSLVTWAVCFADSKSKVTIWFERRQGRTVPPPRDCQSLFNESLATSTKPHTPAPRGRPPCACLSGRRQHQTRACWLPVGGGRPVNQLSWLLPPCLT